jgi:hypothetical protein
MTLRYSNDHAAMIREARKRGMSDTQILESVCHSETRANRRKLIKQWGLELGLSESEALELAKKTGLL